VEKLAHRLTGANLPLTLMGDLVCGGKTGFFHRKLISH